MSEQTEMPKIDKSTWGEGPWQTEPDKANWIHAGMDCMAVRHEIGGHWCGYVAVNNTHHFFEKGYSECIHGHKDCSEYDHSPGHFLRVHGGLTYSRKCQGNVCHIPEPGRPAEVWWLGFDCAHGGDLKPGFDGAWKEAAKRGILGEQRKIRDLLNRIEPGNTYKNLLYVRKQTNSLARQLVKIK